MDLQSLVDEEYKSKRGRGNRLGAAHENPRDAYRDVPILKPPTWHNEVAAYFFFGGLSAGAAMVGSLAELVGGERNSRLARTAHYVSFATLLPCPPLLIDDLGLPLRFHHMMRIFKPSSPMNLGAWALLIHGAGATFTVGRMLASEGKLPIIGFLYKLFPEQLLVIAGLPSSFVLAGYTGVLLGTTSVPVWFRSPLLGALFMASSFSTGVAATHLVAAVSGRENSRERHTLSALGAACGLSELGVLAGYVATTGSESARPLFQGRPGRLFVAAMAAIGLSAALEVASVLAKGNGKGASLLASTAALAGGALLRWAVVGAGHASTADRETTLREMRPRKGSPGWGNRGRSPDRA